MNLTSLQPGAMERVYAANDITNAAKMNWRMRTYSPYDVLPISGWSPIRRGIAMSTNARCEGCEAELLFSGWTSTSGYIYNQRSSHLSLISGVAYVE